MIIVITAWVLGGLVLALAVGAAVRIADALRELPAPADEVVVSSKLAG